MKIFKKILIKNKIFIILFLISVLSGLFWNHRFYFRDEATGGDEWQYACIARGIIYNQEYNTCGVSTTLAPGYPVFLALIFSVFGDNLEIVRFVQLILFGVVSCLVYVLGKIVFNERVGVLAGIISACSWWFANYTGVIIRETLLVFLVLLCVLFLYKAAMTLQNKYFVFSGLAFGAVVLTNFLVQYFLVFVLINFILVMWKKVSWKNGLFKVGIFLIMFFIAISPWLIRNFLYERSVGEKIPSRKGYMLSLRADLIQDLYPQYGKYLLGHMFGYYFVEKIYPELDIHAFRDFDGVNIRQEKMLLTGMSLAKVDNMMFKESFNFVKNNFFKYLSICFLDFLNYNSPLAPQRFFEGNGHMHHTFSDGRHSSIPAVFKVFYLLWFRFFQFVFLFFVGFGLYVNRKSWVKISWMFVFIICFNGVYSAIHALPRYAVQIYSLYIILFSGGFLYFWDKYLSRRISLIKDKFFLNSKFNKAK